jgi:hypothetical protein
MTKPEQNPKPAETPKSETVTIAVKEGDDAELRTAEAVAGPFISNAFAVSKFARSTIGDVSLDKLVLAMAANAERVKGGDMRDVEATLVSQATVLNALFADLMGRSSLNLGSYFDAGERYLKLAFKAGRRSGQKNRWVVSLCPGWPSTWIETTAGRGVLLRA